MNIKDFRFDKERASVKLLALAVAEMPEMLRAIADIIRAFNPFLRILICFAIFQLVKK